MNATRIHADVDSRRHVAAERKWDRTRLPLACTLYRWLPNTFNLNGFAVWRGLVDGGGLSLVSKSILFLSARCVTCVCPYVRSLANAIAMQLRNFVVNSCGLLPKQAKQALNFSPRKVSFSLHNEQGELNVAHIRMPNGSFLFLTKLADMKW